ncbi:MAG: hypothetical protein KatS3mg126_1105 [Lysobacteraceae bacterium]|nr:MAG: hypothetical protein KatS3mg126_1105 [Xanthomonadaceae bacterium]
MLRSGLRRWPLFLVVLAILLAGCGSAGTDVDGNPLPSTTTRSLELDLALLDDAGQPSLNVPAGAQRRIEVTARLRTLTTRDGRVIGDTSSPASNLIVTLTASGATLIPDNGSVLTDAQGRASATLVAGSATGAQVLAASASLEGISGSRSLNYQIVPGAQPRISLKVLDAEGRETSTLRAAEVVQLQAKVEKVTLSADGRSVLGSEPLPGQTVTFSTDAGQFDPPSGVALSDAAGVATARLRAGTVAGAFVVSATLKLSEDLTLAASKGLQVRLPALVLGSGSPFQPGRLALSQSSTEVGTTITLSGEIRDENEQPFTAPVDVHLSSRCAELGSALLSTPVRALNGRFAAPYTPLAGCVGEDLVEADARLPGQLLGAPASAVLQVRQAAAGALAYVDASSTQLALRGRGTAQRSETATVRFRASSNGVGVAGARVRFSLSNAAGGITLSPTEALSDTDGLVTTTVTAGTRAVGFRILASLDNGVTAQSEALTVSSGTPDQDSTSLAVSVFNIEGFNLDGVETELTLRAADFFNNPVADGTRAVLTSEGGAVDPVCVLTAGVCKAILRSQNPRPADGRVSVLITLPGDESFTDLDGNGQYDDGEPFEDLPEAFRDDDEDGQYRIGEPFIDRNGNGVRDPGNGVYDGILCNTGGCRRNSDIDVRASTVIVFATSLADIRISPSSLQLDEISPRTVQIDISDLNGNLPAAGSTIELSTSNGELLTETSFTVGNSNARGPFRILAQLIGDGEPSSGLLTVTVTAPSQRVTTRQITVTDVRLCDTLPAPLPEACEGGDAEVGELVVSPSRFTVQPNDSGRIEVASIGVFAGSGSTRRPFAGVVPTVDCQYSGNASDFTVIADPPAATDASGLSSVRFTLNAGPLPTGSATCTVRAGSQAVDVVFEAAQLTVVRVDAQPSTFTVGPDQVSASFVVQLGVFAQGAGNTLIPVPNLRPVVGACDPGTATGFFILPPSSIPATNDQGGTSATFTVNSGSAPSGTWTCPISAGGVTTTISFTAP